MDGGEWPTREGININLLLNVTQGPVILPLGSWGAYPSGPHQKVTTGERQWVTGSRFEFDCWIMCRPTPEQLQREIEVIRRRGVIRHALQYAVPPVIVNHVVLQYLN